jgi:HPt (histidine-containing phosphotransfer) domain-containing protein
VVLNKFINDKQSRGSSEASSQQEEVTDVQNESSTVTVAVKGLDITRGIKQHGGDRKTYFTVLRSYAADARALLEKIEKVTENDIKDYKLMVHSLKGASQSLFAEHVGDLAGCLENAAIESNFEYIEKNNAVFVETARQLINDINALFTAMEAESPKPVKDKPDESMLMDLLDACIRYDMDTADKIMDKIDEYKYDADDGLSSWLRNNIDVMNYEEIDTRLSNLLKK